MKISASSSAARPPLARMSVSWVLCLVVGLMGVLLLAQATGALVGPPASRRGGKVVTLSVGSRALLGTLLANRLERGTAALTALVTEAPADPDMRAPSPRARGGGQGFCRHRAPWRAPTSRRSPPPRPAARGAGRLAPCARASTPPWIGPDPTGRPRSSPTPRPPTRAPRRPVRDDGCGRYGDQLLRSGDAGAPRSSGRPGRPGGRRRGGPAPQTGVANPASWSPAGTLAAAEDRGRVDQTWAGAVDAVARVPDGPIRAAFETAQARNFSAPPRRSPRPPRPWAPAAGRHRDPGPAPARHRQPGHHRRPRQRRPRRDGGSRPGPSRTRRSGG